VQLALQRAARGARAASTAAFRSSVALTPRHAQRVVPACRCEDEGGEGGGDDVEEDDEGEREGGVGAGAAAASTDTASSPLLPTPTPTPPPHHPLCVVMMHDAAYALASNGSARLAEQVRGPRIPNTH
jgi:hypothetical protein